jgi:hypothetical protein
MNGASPPVAASPVFKVVEKPADFSTRTVNFTFTPKVFYVFILNDAKNYEE